MGILNKLKDAFGRSQKPIESLSEFEAKLSKLQEKTNSDLIALIGTGGRLKGLPLVYASKDNDVLKRFSARLIDFLQIAQNLSNERIIRDIVINYNKDLLFFKPIMKNISFFAIIKSKEEIQALKQLIYKNEQILKELFHEKI